MDKHIMRRGAVLPLALINLIWIITCGEPSRVNEPKWLVITREGIWEKDIDVSGLVPGEDDIELGSDPPLYYPWQGEDSIDYRTGEGFLWVNGKLVGVEFRYADLTALKKPQDILTANINDRTLAIPDLSEFPNLVVATVWPIDDNTAGKLSAIPQKVRLYLNCDELSDTGLARLCTFSNVRGLELGFASEYITPRGIKDLGKLKKLKRFEFAPDEHSPQTFTESLKEISRLKSLQALYISSCTLTDTDIKRLEGLKNLRDLRMIWVKLERRSLQQLNSFGELRELWWASTDDSIMGNELLKQVSTLPKLNTLFLHGLEVGEEGLRHLGTMKNLRTLMFSTMWLRVNQSSSNLSYLDGLTNLMGLQFFQCGIRDSNLAFLQKMPSLKSLGLQETQVSDSALIYLRNLGNLETLNLFHTRITDKSLDVLKDFTNLRVLDLRVTDVTPNGVEKLKIALPQCNVRGI